MRLIFTACCALALLVATTSFVAAEDTEKKGDSWSWGGKSKDEDKKAVAEEEDSAPAGVEGDAQGRSIGGFGPSAAAGGSFSSSSVFVAASPDVEQREKGKYSPQTFPQQTYGDAAPVAQGSEDEDPEVVKEILGAGREGRALDGFQEVYEDPTVRQAIASGDEAQARQHIRNKLCALGLMACELDGKHHLTPQDVIYAQPVHIKPVGRPIPAVPVAGPTTHHRPPGPVYGGPPPFIPGASYGGPGPRPPFSSRPPFVKPDLPPPPPPFATAGFGPYRSEKQNYEPEYPFEAPAKGYAGGFDYLSGSAGSAGVAGGALSGVAPATVGGVVQHVHHHHYHTDGGVAGVGGGIGGLPHAPEPAPVYEGPYAPNSDFFKKDFDLKAGSGSSSNGLFSPTKTTSGSSYAGGFSSYQQQQAFQSSQREDRRYQDNCVCVARHLCPAGESLGSRKESDAGGNAYGIDPRNNHRGKELTIEAITEEDAVTGFNSTFAIKRQVEEDENTGSKLDMTEEKDKTRRRRDAPENEDDAQPRQSYYNQFLNGRGQCAAHQVCCRRPVGSAGGVNKFGPNGVSNGVINNYGVNGPGINGVGINGVGINGVGINGAGINGVGINGAGINGAGINGAGINGGGIYASNYQAGIVNGVNNLGINAARQGVCGKRNTHGINGRIKNPVYVDGDSEFGEYPWQAAILKKDVQESVYVCGGTLIDAYHVLTAAHCVKGYGPHDLRVRLGEWDVNHDVEFYPHEESDVTRLTVHPEFYAGTLYNDLAILRLQRPVDFARSPHISPACMPDRYRDYSGARCWTTGWGKDAFGDFGKYQNILKEVEVPVVPQHTCQSQLQQTRLGYEFKLHPGFICAGGEEGKDACKGDGGGPMVCEQGGSWQLVGVVSWGIGCGQYGVPGVYVKVAHYLDWIRQITGQP
ncbi:uncharacterized protein LOC124165869 isoform X2 [Ischnura elegans]|uniref:uncharacterized protein LOC124165869 isoform X2 n=1 Tax=Ischnura elegans TaxID=197161 RepID=UPI001ED87D53|nr:uncharacterized protein LOC124165869 isoform X2 [Ischnura elegans]